jgi:hypothetical protein
VPAARGRLLRRGRRFHRTDERKLGHYQASLDMLSDLMPAHTLVEQLREELGALHGLPADA